ncbi:hypothetical protein C0J52_14909, partial [Blattella germanica]
IQLGHGGDHFWDVQVNQVTSSSTVKSTCTTFPSINPIKSNKTDNGYTLLPGFGYYKLYSESVPWLEASKNCFKEDSQLLFLKSKEEAIQVGTNIVNQTVTRYSWVAITDQYKEGQWVTIHNQTLESTGFSEWYLGDPNGGINENCADFYYESPTAYGYFDWYCEQNLAYICKHKLSTIPEREYILQDIVEIVNMENELSAITDALELDSSQSVKLPDDWRREVRQRRSGKSAGHYDVYLISPEGERVRSKKQLTSFLENNYPHLSLSDFSETIFRYCDGKSTLPKRKYIRKKRTSKQEEELNSSQSNSSQDMEVMSDLPASSINMNLISQSASREALIEKITTEIQEIHCAKKRLKKREAETIKCFVDHFETSGHFGKKRLVNKSDKKTKWTPPRSPYNLVQEVLYHDEWQLLVATMFLHKTSCHMAIPRLWVFLNKWNSPQAVCEGDVREIIDVLKPLGLQEKRAVLIKQMSEAYLRGNWENVAELPGIGTYGMDSHSIFCKGNWKSVNPTDKKLRKYKEFLASKCSGLKVRRNEVKDV